MLLLGLLFALHSVLALQYILGFFPFWALLCIKITVLVLKCASQVLKIQPIHQPGRTQASMANECCALCLIKWLASAYIYRTNRSYLHSLRVTVGSVVLSHVGNRGDLGGQLQPIPAL